MMHGGGASCAMRVQYYSLQLACSGTSLFESTLNGFGMPLARMQMRAS
jgi:hypothetical protein